MNPVLLVSASPVSFVCHVPAQTAASVDCKVGSFDRDRVKLDFCSRRQGPMACAILSSSYKTKLGELGKSLMLYLSYLKLTVDSVMCCLNKVFLGIFLNTVRSM